MAHRRDGEIFGGVAGRTLEDSTPWWPEPRRAPAGAPNVLIVVLDDVGYSDFGCYGSEIATPTIDALAASGLRYTGFHTTALCSPTRACLLTGRNHHSVGMGGLADWDHGFPGTRGRVAKSAGTLAEMLRAQRLQHLRGRQVAPHADGRDLGGRVRSISGRRSAASTATTASSAARPTRSIPSSRATTIRSKPRIVPATTSPRTWSITPSATSATRPRSLPIARSSSTSRSAPATRRTRRRASSSSVGSRCSRKAGTRRARNVSRARSRWGSCRPATQLPPRNDRVRAWGELSPTSGASRSASRPPTPACSSTPICHLGRLVAYLEQLGRRDDTLVVLISDNGASQEGSALGTVNAARYFNAVRDDLAYNLEHLDEIGEAHLNNNYPQGWAMAGNTPFKRYKQNTHGGGVRDPLIVSWPARIQRARRDPRRRSAT